MQILYCFRWMRFLVVEINDRTILLFDNKEWQMNVRTKLLHRELLD